MVGINWKNFSLKWRKELKNSTPFDKIAKLDCDGCKKDFHLDQLTPHSDENGITKLLCPEDFKKVHGRLPWDGI